jgi:hypothetical protein
MGKTSVFLDRYRIHIQKKRERNKRTLVELNWKDVGEKVKDMKGLTFKIRNGRNFAIVKAYRNKDHSVPFFYLEGGIYSPGKVPNQWKPGDDHVKQVKLAGEHEWIYPAYFAFPENGNQIILHSTKNGPHIGDIAWWIKSQTECHYVDYEYVPIGDFYDAFKRNNKYKHIALSVKRRPSFPSEQGKHLESKLGHDSGAGVITVQFEPEKDKLFSKATAKKIIDRFIPFSTNSVRDAEPYELNECSLTPTESEDGSPTDILRFFKGTRRLVPVDSLDGGGVSREAVKVALGNELESWIGK